MRCLRGLFAAVLLAVPAAAEDVQITHGPMLGRLTQESVAVWARTSRPGGFLVRYGTQPEQLDQASAPAATALERDNTGVAVLENLQPDTRYYYAVVAAGENTAPPPAEHRGQFRTLPLSERLRDEALNPRGLFNFRFEFACGNNQDLEHGSGPSLPAFAVMRRHLRDKVHFAILNGDWLYEDRREFSAAAWAKRQGLGSGDVPRVVQIAPTIAGVWENYKVYLSRGKNLAAWHRDVPTFFTFDDHEILNDVYGCGTPGLRDRRAVFRDIGLQAWHDYLAWSNPTAFRQGIHFGRADLTSGSDVLVDDQADFTRLDLGQAANLHVHWGTDTAGVNDNKLDAVGGEPAAGVYEIVEVLDAKRLRIRPAPKADGLGLAYSIGRRWYWRMRVANCEFFFLDTRSHRQLHDVAQPDKPGLSMLGAAQRRWLDEAMQASDADFLFVVSSVNFMVPHVGGGAVRETNKDDAWTVFLDEREALITSWDRLGKPVFVLTGDLHNSFAIKITDRVWEFASGPHNSNNHRLGDEGDRPAAGRFQYGPRRCDIRWSTAFRNDIPRDQLRWPTYCVVQVNNVYNNPLKVGQTRWVAYERPQVVFQYYDGRTGDLRYAEAIPAADRPAGNEQPRRAAAD